MKLYFEKSVTKRMLQILLVLTISLSISKTGASQNTKNDSILIDNYYKTIKQLEGTRIELKTCLDKIDTCNNRIDSCNKQKAGIHLDKKEAENTVKTQSTAIRRRNITILSLAGVVVTETALILRILKP